MKKTFYLFLTIAFWLSCCPGSNAQNLRFGVKAGAGVANLDYEPESSADTFDFDFYRGLFYNKGSNFRPTFLLGGVLEYDLSKDFFLSGGVQITGKFAHVEADDPRWSTNDFRLRAFYMQIPMNVHYRAGKFFLGAGGYAGIGIGGKWKNTNVYEDPDGDITKNSSDKIKFGNDDFESNLKRFDAGLRAEIGFGIKRIRLSLAYDHGLANNLSKFKDGKQVISVSKLRHQAITVTAAYYWLAK